MVAIYTTKTPAERVAARLTGTELHKRMYKCGCSSKAKWIQYRAPESDPQSSCPRCGAWRLPVDIWEV